VTTTTEWLVIAAICDCGHVAITVMNNHDPDNTEPSSDEEITATGPDWRPLVPKVANALHDRTGCRISGMCSTVLVRRDHADQKPALLTELTNLVYATAEGDQS
jgi:hypothetical protein